MEDKVIEDKFYDGKPCNTCGNTKRYKSNFCCFFCKNKGRKEIKKKGTKCPNCATELFSLYRRSLREEGIDFAGGNKTCIVFNCKECKMRWIELNGELKRIEKQKMRSIIDGVDCEQVIPGAKVYILGKRMKQCEIEKTISSFIERKSDIPIEAVLNTMGNR
jgi:hypothetical protein